MVRALTRLLSQSPLLAAHFKINAKNNRFFKLPGLIIKRLTQITRMAQNSIRRKAVIVGDTACGKTSLILALIQGEVPYVTGLCPPPDLSQLTHHRYMFQLYSKTTLLSSKSTNVLSNSDFGTLRAMRTMTDSGPILIRDLTLLSYVSPLTPRSPSRMLKRSGFLKSRLFAPMCL